MKLRTEILETSGGWYAFGSTVDSSHDLLAAHALLQAMCEYDREGWNDQANPVAWARERAAEILAGWLGGSTHNSARDGCGCRACNDPTWTNRHFIVCPKCGNKRCPKAENHEYACTGSNEPGQVPKKEQEVE